MYIPAVDMSRLYSAKQGWAFGPAHPSQNQQEPELDNQIFPEDENLGMH